jgi:hypothetical protein
MTQEEKAGTKPRAPLVEPTMKVKCAWCGRDMGRKPCAPDQVALVSHDMCETCEKRNG